MHIDDSILFPPSSPVSMAVVSEDVSNLQQGLKVLEKEMEQGPDNFILFISFAITIRRDPLMIREEPEAIIRVDWFVLPTSRSRIFIFLR